MPPQSSNSADTAVPGATFIRYPVVASPKEDHVDREQPPHYAGWQRWAQKAQRQQQRQRYYNYPTFGHNDLNSHSTRSSTSSSLMEDDVDEDVETFMQFSS